MGPVMSFHHQKFKPNPPHNQTHQSQKNPNPQPFVLEAREPIRIKGSSCGLPVGMNFDDGVCVWTGCELTLLTLSHHADAGISWRLPHSDPRNESAEGPGKEYGSAFRTEALITCVRWAFLILLTGVILLNFLLLTYSAESIVVWYGTVNFIQYSRTYTYE